MIPVISSWSKPRSRRTPIQPRCPTYGGRKKRSGAEPISAAQAQRLTDGALVLMRDSGVAFEPGSEALEILRAAAGCAVSDDGVVRFEPERVRDALESVAKSATLWDRNATRSIDLDCRHTCSSPA